jgi:hypothetical protein
MVSVFSTIAYVVESNTITPLNSSNNNSTITRGVIACNRPQNNNPIFVNFISFDELVESNQVYFLNGKFVNNANKLNNNSQELQVNN